MPSPHLPAAHAACSGGVLQADGLLFNGHREPRKWIAALHIVRVADNLGIVGTAEQDRLGDIVWWSAPGWQPPLRCLPRALGRKIAALCHIRLEKQSRWERRSRRYRTELSWFGFQIASIVLTSDITCFSDWLYVLTQNISFAFLKSTYAIFSPHVKHDRSVSKSLPFIHLSFRVINLHRWLLVVLII
jgi:hypothetical protein